MSTAYTDILRHIRSVMAKQATGVLSDRQLLESFLNQRSEAAFTALVQRHGAMVLGVCRRLLRHTQDAEDAFQATFLALAQQAASIRRQESVGSWLHGVACRIAAKMKRAAARRIVHEGRLPPRPPGDAMDDITWRELRAVLDEELRLLPEKYRSPLVLCYLEARTQDEATRQLGWSKSTFGRRLNRARQLLAQRLTRRGLTLPAALTAPLLIDGAARAAVPPLLAANTVRAGLALASGQPIGALASASVVALAESGGKVWLASKAKWALALLLALSGAAGSVLTHQTPATKPAAPQPAARQTKAVPPPARSASKDRSIEIKGRVLDPDGKPLPGAKVYLPSYTYSNRKEEFDPKIVTETDGNGRFALSAGRAQVESIGAMAVAEGPRYAPDWVSLKEVRESKELTLRLVKDDVHIKGRVLDLEGQPVAGATVRLVFVQKMPDEDLAPYIKELQAKPTDRNATLDVEAHYSRIMLHLRRFLGSPKPVTTGPDGRFELRGLGRERVVVLSLEGPGIESRFVKVLTRPGLEKGLPLDRHGPIFDHLAVPSKPIRGTVRDKGTGKPLAGITVDVQPRSGDGFLFRDNSTTTDERGQYRIDGIAKQREYDVSAGGKPYFTALKSSIADTPGLDPLAVDFELERGIAINGRVVNKATGQPLRNALVYYHVSADNPNYKNLAARNLQQQSVLRASTDGFTSPDGSFTLVGYPGPGYLAVMARDDDYRKPDPPEHWNTLAPRVRHRLPRFHAWVRINPSENDPKSTRCEVALESAKSISGQVLDPEGKPLSGFFAAGLTGTPISVPNQYNLQETPSFRVRGLDPGRPRTLAIIHPKKRLGKVVTVREDQAGPLQVRLEPLGAVAGRVLDADGRPRSGVQVRVAFFRNVKDDNPSPTISAIYFGCVPRSDRS